jgi:hypothetical protein
VATPVGPAPRNPNDPDFWDWGEDDDALDPGRRPLRPLRLIVVGVIVLAMVLLLVVNFL